MVKANRTGITQNFYLGIHRNDYMLHSPKNALYQVEINTISAAFAGLGTLVSKLHRFLIKRYNILGFLPENLPPNDALNNVSYGISKAHELYGNPNSVVMFIIQGSEKNTTDQRLVEYSLFENYGINVIRRTLTDIAQRAQLGDNNVLLLDGQEISVCYFRAGYGPKDYPEEEQWNARYMMEISRAIKCPSAAYQLVGTKKIQQIFSNTQVLEKFLDSPEEIGLVKSCFTGLYSLDPDCSAEIIPQVLSNPTKYVMKPQREGGGNLLTNEIMINAINTFSPEELSSYIIMDRIEPDIHECYFLRGDKFGREQSVSEMGIYAIYLGNGDQEICNQVAGTLLRTKSSTKEDGGVVAGVAVLDSIYLTS